MTKESEFAKQIVEQMSADDRETFDRASWRDGIGQQCEADMSVAAVLDDVEAILDAGKQ